jgi:hypothetical protein
LVVTIEIYAYLKIVTLKGAKSNGIEYSRPSYGDASTVNLFGFATPLPP